jgi:multidrug efflux system membrane fusion protein
VAALVLLLAVLGWVFRHDFLPSHGQEAGQAGAAGGGGKPQQAPAAITVGAARTGDMPVYVNTLGTVTPVTTVSVYSLNTGQVTRVFYHEGQIVKKNDPLIDIDARPYQATLAQAEGTLERDRAQLNEAQMDLKRYRTAFAKGAIAKQLLDDQEQLVLQDTGTVGADEGAVAYDQVQLGYCHIVSPITGRVGLRLVDTGNVVFAGAASTLLVITQLQPITVVFNVAEDELPGIQAQLHGAKPLTVDAFDRSDEKLIESGQLIALDNAVDTTTGTVKFRAELANQALALYPNQFVNARLLVQTLHQVTLIPTAAVQHNGTDAFVYLVKPDTTVAVQPITVLTSDDHDTAVKGVDAGAKLATSGFDRLENGVTVQVRDPHQDKGSEHPEHADAKTGGSAAP